MVFVIDIGNTKIKTAVFEADKLVVRTDFEYENWQKNILKKIDSFSKIETVIVASVAKFDENDFLFLSKFKLIFITNNTKLPFHNLYTTPNTLGIDRKVLAAGAVLKYQNINRLIIDAGTCVTYDFVDSNNSYFGGAISPGLRIRYKSLHDYTAKLPLLEAQMPEHFIGNATSESIHAGVIYGLLHEIDGFIDHYRAIYENFIIILTGGDTEFLAKQLKNIIFANENFLLESLNLIYQYQEHD
ncbi:type III pantothenate kinase [Flavobacterium croceum DSM 17960]|uniref:Type III pantothenate kinase n=1 Tax=Flavobacterium croceum DSM 17960 TaxID=1121886 RepID=A0A2S4NAB4_9FLAO|nr:type III pantothenate kinase [Flavobacterium croceum]POS02637.1 type III pantothenate kinase [Flavobacterium croceum DSM 17960]